MYPSDTFKLRVSFWLKGQRSISGHTVFFLDSLLVLRLTQNAILLRKAGRSFAVWILVVNLGVADVAFMPAL